jgi:ubiquinone biosynthesis protein
MHAFSLSTTDGPSAEPQAAIARFLQILPPEAATTLFTAMSSGEFDRATIENALLQVDWRAHRDVVEGLLREVLPVARLVPDTYRQWRPVVRDGFAFVGARLSAERLVPKLVEQLALPNAIPVEDRVFGFIRRIPTLQKIGQIVARNTNLDANFRSRLTVLEDGIQEADEGEIRSAIERQLAPELERQQIALQPGLYAEGSVSALMRFTQPNLPAGVFKVLKPFITRYFQEDIAALAELADYFDANKGRYDLGQLNLRAILDNVRHLFERETDFVNERRSLTAAALRLAGVPGVRVPVPITSLSTDTITAMTDEPSVKATDAFPDEPRRRRDIAHKLVECLVAIPLFWDGVSSPFHADPHAGNLRVNPTTGDVVLLDWALTDSLTPEERRRLILLIVALPLRDEGQILAALSELSLSKTKQNRSSLKRQIELFMDTLPFGSIPGPGSLNNLTERLLREGLTFSGSFLIFRKMLATLGDVVEQISPGETIEQLVAEYALPRVLPNYCLPPAGTQRFRLPLEGSDIFRIGLSAQSFLARLWLQTVRGLARGIGKLRRGPPH